MSWLGRGGRSDLASGPEPGDHDRIWGEEKGGGIGGWFERANKKVLFGGVIVAVVVGALIATQMRGALLYYLTVDELKARGTDAYGDRFRVGGRVLRGTLQKDAESNVNFTIYHNEPTDTVAVRYKGAVPDLVQEEGDVIVEGTWQESGVFHATTLLAQHPPEFKIAETGRPHDKVTDRDYSAD